MTGADDRKIGCRGDAGAYGRSRARMHSPLLAIAVTVDRGRWRQPWLGGRGQLDNGRGGQRRRRRRHRHSRPRRRYSLPRRRAAHRQTRHCSSSATPTGGAGQWLGRRQGRRRRVGGRRGGGAARQHRARLGHLGTRGWRRRVGSWPLGRPRPAADAGGAPLGRRHRRALCASARATRAPTASAIRNGGGANG